MPCHLPCPVGMVQYHPKLNNKVSCRRAKAAFAAFSDRELPQLKLDRPGLKQSQYKEALFKVWQKSPENPLNRAAG